MKGVEDAGRLGLCKATGQGVRAPQGQEEWPAEEEVRVLPQQK